MPSHRPRRPSDAEEALYEALLAEPLAGWDLVREYQFDPERRWRFDFAFPSQRLAVEVDGARHRTHRGQSSDCEKGNAAVLAGWRVLHFVSGEKRKAAEWAALIREALCFTPAAF